MFCTVPNQTVNSRNNDVNAGSGSYANNTHLSELTLPTFTDSTSQVPLHFISDLDQYFSLKRTPGELRLALVFRAVKEPFVKQWLSSSFDRMKNDDEFKKAFNELLWCPSRQASIRSAIYLDKHDPGSGESCLDHYIRYANMASTLNPQCQIWIFFPRLRIILSRGFNRVSFVATCNLFRTP